MIPVPQPFMVSNSPSYKPCHCRRTGCFKLYCDCLRAGLLCSDKCKCTGCKNRVPNEQREKLLNLVKAKVDFSSPSPNNQGSSLTPTRGCHCKKSHCLKNYCECFQNGVPCSQRCSCKDCKNTNISYLIGRKKSAGKMSNNSTSGEHFTPKKDVSGQKMAAASASGGATSQSPSKDQSPMQQRMSTPRTKKSNQQKMLDLNSAINAAASNIGSQFTVGNDSQLGLNGQTTV